MNHEKLAIVSASVLASAITASFVGTAVGMSFGRDRPIETDHQTAVPAVESPEPSKPPLWSESEIEVLAKMLYGEARGCPKTDQAAAVWCALNRVDSPRFPDNIIDVVTQPGQFQGYNPGNPVTDSLVGISEDVVTRWYDEKGGSVDVGRVLPEDYLFFYGDRLRNHFTTEYGGGETWDWSLPSPYGE